MRRVVFGPFTLDLDNGDLANAQGPIKLDAQPTKLLVLLVERAGATLTREEIERALWGDDIVVDFDGSIRACIRKIRSALGDSATTPRYVETQVGRGYRFLEAVATAFGSSVVQRHVVGRDTLSKELDDALEDAGTGSGRFYLVSGEAGIGKTTLVESFLERATSKGSTVLKGWCSERLDGTEAYLPIVDALDQPLKASTVDLKTDIERLAPSWHAHVSGVETQAEVSSQKRMHREMSALFDALSQRQALVLFVDDLHWADAATFDLIVYLATRARSSRLLMILTYRTKEGAPPPFRDKLLDMKSRHLCREIELTYLKPEDVSSYIAQSFDPNAFPRDFDELVHRRTAGSPLFMVELLRFLKEHGAVLEQDGVWQLDAAVHELQTELPETLKSLIERKLGRLTEAQRNLLSVGCVQGHEFDSAVVADALQLEQADVEEELQTVETTFGLIETADEAVLPNGQPSVAYRFTHLQYQNALYSSLVMARRMKLSRAVAEALQDDYGDRASEIAADLALLWMDAHEPRRAAEHFLVAAQKSSNVFAYTECLRLVHNGLTLIERLEPSERGGLELRFRQLHASALMATEGFGADELTHTLDRLQELYEAAGESDRVHATLFGKFSFNGFRGNLKQAGATCQELWRSVNRAGSPHVFVGSWARAISFFLTGQLQDACTYYEKAKAEYDPAHHGPMSEVYAIDSGVGVYAYASWASWYAGRPELAANELKRALDDAKQRSPLSRVIANGFAAHLDMLERRVDACESRAQAAYELAEEHALRPFAAWAAIHHGWALVQRGEHQDGLELLADGLERYERTGSRLLKTAHLATFADACGTADQPEHGLELIDAAFDAVLNGEGFTCRSFIASGVSSTDRWASTQAPNTASRKLSRPLATWKPARWKCARP